MVKNFNDFLNEVYVGKDFGFDIDNSKEEVQKLITSINKKYNLNIDEKLYKFPATSKPVEKDIRMALISKAVEYFGVQGSENKVTKKEFQDFLRDYTETESQFPEYSYTFINAVINSLKDNGQYLKDIEDTYKEGTIKTILKNQNLLNFYTGDIYLYKSDKSKRYGIYLYKIDDKQFYGIEGNIPIENGYGVSLVKRNTNGEEAFIDSKTLSASETPKELKIFDFSLMACNDKAGTPLPKEYEGNALEVLSNLEKFSNEIGNPKIDIISGYRTKEHNDKVGGVDDSQHLVGRAVDFKVEGMKPTEVFKKVKELIKDGKIKNGGVGLYDNFVHYDTRDENIATWDNRKKSKGDVA